MLKHFTEDTCQGDWSIIGWVSFISCFENRGYICFFPDGWELSCIKGFLINQLEDGSKFFVKGLQDYRFKLIWTSCLVGI